MKEKMIGMSLACALVLVVFAVGVGTTSGENDKGENLVMKPGARLAQLERRVAVLEKEVQELKARVKTLAPAGKPLPPRIGSKRAWRQLKKGMSTDKVRKLLGKPNKVETTAPMQVTWRYDNMGAIHFKNAQVSAWYEPRWPENR